MYVRTLFIVFCLSLFPFAAYAQNNAVVPASTIQVKLSFAPVVKKVTPSVVNIYTKQIVQQRVSPFLADPFFRQFFGEMRLPPREANSLGSGVIVRKDGLIVTNAHVAKNADEIRVVLSDKREFPAKVALVDEKSDLALLKIDAKSAEFPTLKLADSDAIEVGDITLAIGNPFGVGQTVTSGIVSATARTSVGSGNFGYYIQTDAAINPGNSGGALVNNEGDVIGINTMIFSKTGGYMGIGFAVPSNLVKQVIASYASGGKTVQRAWLGASLQPVTRDIAESLSLDRPHGVLVSKIYKGGPAEKAGLKSGDVIAAMDGRSVDDTQSLYYILTTQEIGKELNVTILRNGQETERVLPVELPPAIKSESVVLKGNHPLSGAKVEEISPVMLEEQNGSLPEQGIVITEVGGIAARLGVRPGDVITTVNGMKIENIEILQNALSKRQRVWRIDLVRDGQRLNIMIQG